MVYNKFNKPLLFLLGVLAAILYASFYTVNQGYSALVFRVGNIVSQTGPGVHFKIPIIESIQNFDTRLQTLNVDSSRILTQEQKICPGRLLCKMAD